MQSCESAHEPICAGSTFCISKENIHLNQTIVFAVIQVVPCALFPVLIRHRTDRSSGHPTRSPLSTLPLLTRRALGARFSFSAILSIDTRSSFVTWRSLGSSLPWATLVTFGSFTAITPVTAWCPRGPRLAVETWYTTIIERRRLLD